jgi:hypothetical protein
MARKIALKTVSVKNGLDKPTVFSYGEMMQAILKFASQGKGLVLDDVIKAVDALKPLEQAMTEKADHVTYSEEQYQTLKGKLDDFQFAIADAAIAEFGLAIRNAKEIT